jgi:hypothetical protein
LIDFAVGYWLVVIGKDHEWLGIDLGKLVVGNKVQ